MVIQRIVFTRYSYIDLQLTHFQLILQAMKIVFSWEYKYQNLIQILNHDIVFYNTKIMFQYQPTEYWTID